MPRFLAVFLTTLSLALATVCASAASPVPPPPALPAKGYVLLDAFSGRILVGQNDQERLEPASLTKLMTAYVVFHALHDEIGRASCRERV